MPWMSWEDPVLFSVELWPGVAVDGGGVEGVSCCRRVSSAPCEGMVWNRPLLVAFGC